MTAARYILLLIPVLLLSACASTPSADEAAASQAQAAQERATAEAELEAERLRQEQLLAEDRAREAAAARETAAREAAAAAERQAALAEATRQQQQPSVEERARSVARQQERIADLRAQIAANQTETTNLESANTSLQQAIVAAEDLVTTLTEEQDKYGTTDPATGATLQPLSKERIAELNAELERLQTRAAALTQGP